MAKGKYAARAANRAAALDNDVIVDLRSQLREIEAERDEARRELAVTRSSMSSEILRQVAERTTHEREEIHNTLLAEREAYKREKAAAAEEVALVVVEMLNAFRRRIGELDEGAQDFVPKILVERSDSDRPSLIRVFEMLAPERTGALMETAITMGGELPLAHSRSRKRRSAAQMHSDRNYRDHSGEIVKGRLVKKLKAASQ